MKIKKLFAAGIAALMIAGSTMTAMAGWIANGNLWFYQHSDGRWAANEWVGSYYIGPQGYMLTNTWTPDGYYVGSDGKWLPIASNEDINANASVVGTYAWQYTESGSNVIGASFIDTREVTLNADKSITVVERINGAGQSTSQVSFMETNHYVSVMNGLDYTFNNGELIIKDTDGNKLHFAKIA